MRQIYITITMLIICFESIAQTNENILIQETQSEYNTILQDLQENRAYRVKLENKLEKTRLELRKAKRASSQKKKNELLKTMQEYNVIQNPVYDPMSQGLQPGYSVYIPKREVDGLSKLFAKNMTKEFKAYMKNYSVGKVKRKRGEIFFENIIIPEISIEPLNIYAQVEKQLDGILLKSYFDKGDSFIDFSIEDNSTLNAKNILVHFAKAIHKIHLEEEIIQQEKELQRTEKELENQQEKINDTREKILESEALILDTQQRIIDTETKIDTIRDEINSIKVKISKIELN